MSIIDIIIAILAPFLYILCLTGLFIYLFGKRYNFQTILPLALISTTLFVFIFTAIFHNITVGFWITVVAALFFIPLFVSDKDRSRTLREKLLTPGFVIFCLIFVFVCLLNWFKVVQLLSDSSMHWAPHVWTMWLRNDFYTSPNLSIVIHGDYPPIIQLFELMWCKAAGLYREGLLYVAIQILSFSMLLPIFSKFTWEKSKKLRDWSMIMLFTFTLISTPLILFVSNFYSSLEVDTALAFIFYYGIYLAMTESKRFTLSGLVKLTLLITFLMLSKQIAILLAGIIILVYLSNLYLSYHRKFHPKLIITKQIHRTIQWRTHWKVMTLVFIILVFPLFCVKLWSAQIVDYRSPDAGVAIFHLEPTSILQIPSILSKQSGSDAQQNFARNFIEHIIFDSGGIVLNYFDKVTYMQLVLLFVGVMVLILFTYQTKRRRHRFIILSTIMTTGWLFYSFAIYSIFLFGGMNDVELNNIDVVNRYLRTYLFALLLIVVMLVIKKVIDGYLVKKDTKTLKLFIAAIVIIFGILFNKQTLDGFGFTAIRDYKDQLSTFDMAETANELDEVAKFSHGTFEKPAKTLISARTDYERHYLQYNALPNRISLLLFDNNTSQPIVCDALRKNEYFIIGYEYPSDKEWNTIKDCLDGGNGINRNGIYKIKLTEDKIFLDLIN